VRHRFTSATRFQGARWLALATLLHRYSGSSETALDQDLRACCEGDAVGALLKNLRQLRPSLVAQPEDFSGALVDRSGLLALYIACVQRGILDFFTGAKVLLQNAVDRHHILPRGQFPEDARTTADNVANIAFIVSDVNRSIGQSGPEVYLKRIESRVLRSQCVPSNQKLWAIDRAEEFWAARRELLAKAFNDFLRDSFPTRRLGYVTHEMTEELIAWLNARMPVASRTKVEPLIRLLQKVELGNLKKNAGLVRKANEILKRCKLYRWVNYAGSPGEALWMPAGKTNSAFAVIPGTDVPIYEEHAIFYVAELYEKRFIDRLRRCVRCQKWLCARFSHQLFCSTRCRETHFHASPEWKEKRRRKAREYYRLHMTKNVK
jgi:hypothetical protein